MSGGTQDCTVNVQHLALECQRHVQWVPTWGEFFTALAMLCILLVFLVAAAVALLAVRQTMREMEDKREAQRRVEAMPPPVPPGLRPTAYEQTTGRGPGGGG